MFHSLRLTLVTLAFCTSGVVIAQELPSDYQDVLKVLDRKGVQNFHHWIRQSLAGASSDDPCRA